MNDKLTRALAEWEGYKHVISPKKGVFQGVHHHEVLLIPTYDDNHIDEMVRGLGNDDSYMYYDALSMIVATDDQWGDPDRQEEIILACLKATTEQKAEALARTYGIWTDDMKEEA